MKKHFTLITSLLMAFTLFAQNQDAQTTKKMLQLMWMMDNFYVDTLNLPNITEKGMVEMLKQLDPHSAYIPKKDVAAMNEPLQGSIIGIGITYQLSSDTIHVVDVVADGPSEKSDYFPEIK